MSIEQQLSRLNRYLNILAQEAPFSAARLAVLKLIKRNNPVTLSQLAEFQQVSMPTMSKLVDELQNSGFVIRAQSKDDARQRWIVPTQKGILKLVDIEVENQHFWHERLVSLTDEQSEDISKSLDLLLNTIKPEPF